MKILNKRLFWGIPIIALAVLLSLSFADFTKKEVVLTEAITQFLALQHYAQMPMDDVFSERAFDLYLEMMDFNKRYLYQSDIDELSKFRHDVDDELKKREFMFFDLSSELIQKRLLETDEFFEKYLNKPFDLDRKEEIETDPEKQTYAKDKKELGEIWRKSLKFQVTARVANSLMMQEKAAAKSDTVKQKSIEVLEQEARKNILETYQDWHDRVSQMDRDDRRAVYLNAVVNAYDPHSMYMPPRDKTRFDINMAGKYEGIGATLRQKEGYLLVVDMFPGSPSWRGKQMEVGDLIMKVAQGDEEAVDILDMKQDKAVELIKGPKNTKVRLTLRKVDGSITEISIIRDVIIMEETYASSLIIKNKENKSKIGYINLPKFYLDFQDQNGRRCSDDVLQEIKKLQEEQVEGIIIDLRNNGGGSLPEVVKMAGLFIDRGPIVQVKMRTGQPYILDDTDSRIQYDGPLAVMTNFSSASASEIFAAAIQDYNRGVIIGSPSTWGKGTVQRVSDLDDIIPPKLNDVKPLGALSLTVQKYYRINGKTTQLKGVIPDVILPDSYQYLDIGEKEEKYALSWDEISKAKYGVWNPPYNLEDVRKSSSSRLSKDTDFKLITENAERLKKESDRSIFPLDLKSYIAYLKQQEKDTEKYMNLMKDPTSIHLLVAEADKKILISDTAKSERTERMIEDLKKDIYLEEAFFVMKDMLQK